MAGVSNTDISKDLTDFRNYAEGEFRVARSDREAANKDRQEIRNLAEKHERILIGKNGDPGLSEMMRDLVQKVTLVLRVFSFVGISIGGWLIGRLLGLI